MKRLFLIFVMIFFITGCVYSERRSPYGYSSYSTVTPVYPRYQEQQHYYIQTPRYIAPPTPYFRAYEERSEHRREHHRENHREHQREHDNDNNHDEHSRHRHW